MYLLLVILVAGFSLNSTGHTQSNVRKIVAIAAGHTHTLALSDDGTVWAWGNNESGCLGDGTNITRNKPVQVKGLNNVKAIAAGSSHSIALKNDGTVWSWGTGEQLGINSAKSSNAPSKLSD